MVPAVDKLVSSIDAAIGVHGSMTSQRRLIDSMKQKLDEYIPLVRTKEAKMATALDPIFSLSYFEGKEMEEVRDVLVTSFKEFTGEEVELGDETVSDHSLSSSGRGSLMS